MPRIDHAFVELGHIQLVVQTNERDDQEMILLVHLSRDMLDDAN